MGKKVGRWEITVTAPDGEMHDWLGVGDLDESEIAEAVSWLGKVLERIKYERETR